MTDDYEIPNEPPAINVKGRYLLLLRYLHTIILSVTPTLCQKIT